MAGRERHRRAVLEVDVAQHPAGLRRPRQHAERGGIGDHEEVAAALHLRHAEAAARREDRKRRLVRGVLGESVVVIEQPLRMTAAASPAITDFPRRMPCWSGNDSARPRAVFLDPLVALDRGLELLVAPQAVALDEAVRGSLLR
jgi:hypothetical protein